MIRLVFRALGGIVGFAAALAAIVVPLLVIANELQGADSSGRALGSSLAALLLAVFLGFIAYWLLRFSLRGPRAY